MAETAVPDVLTHYYDAARGPFRSLTALPPDDANRLQAQIVAEARGFASQRTPDYLAVRRELEQRIRRLFVAKGGCPEQDTPHYFIVGTCDWMLTWYERPACLGVPLASVDPAVVSLTYGDSFPAMRYPDGKPWRGQVYTLGAARPHSAVRAAADLECGRVVWPGPLHRGAGVGDATARPGPAGISRALLRALARLLVVDVNAHVLGHRLSTPLRVADGQIDAAVRPVVPEIVVPVDAVRLAPVEAM